MASLPLLITCGTQVSGPDDTVAPPEITPPERKLLESGESFSFQLFRNTVSEDDVENIFISPLSVSIALGMTMNGAKGETFNQMKETLAFNNLTMREINEGYDLLIERLESADPEVDMNIANSIWGDKGFSVRPDFRQNVENFFDARVQSLDFDDPESVETINDWVNENTNGLIEEIIQDIPPSTVMYLINAIYFNADWTHPFDPENTRERAFTLKNGETIMTDMMAQERRFNTYFSDEVRMIDVPYSDSLYSMTIMMPGNENTSLNEFIANSLTNDNFNAWLNNLSYQNVQFVLPKLELEYEITMNDVLKNMGMEDAFNVNDDDLSGIVDGGTDLFISEVKHKAFVTVDEEGTEAAAVTSVGVGVTSAPPAFIANRPYLFFIREQQTGAVVFMGKVGNPAISSN
jgi:serpin B